MNCLEMILSYACTCICLQLTGSLELWHHKTTNGNGRVYWSPTDVEPILYLSPIGFMPFTWDTSILHYLCMLWCVRVSELDPTSNCLLVLLYSPTVLSIYRERVTWYDNQTYVGMDRLFLYFAHKNVSFTHNILFGKQLSVKSGHPRGHVISRTCSY